MKKRLIIILGICLLITGCSGPNNDAIVNKSSNTVSVASTKVTKLSYNPNKVKDFTYNTVKNIIGNRIEGTQKVYFESGGTNKIVIEIDSNNLQGVALVEDMQKDNKNILIQLMKDASFKQLDRVSIENCAKFKSKDYEIAQIQHFDITNLNKMHSKTLKSLSYDTFIYPDLQQYY